MIDRYNIHKILFDDLQHEFEQKLLNHFPDSDYVKVEGIIKDILDKVHDELESRELVLVSEDDLSCMEDDYKEACDRLITCGTIAKEGLSATDINNKNAFGIDDITMAHSKFDEILTEVES